MQTTQVPSAQVETDDDLSKIPGFDTALDEYTAVLTECMTEVTASFMEASRNDGVPPVRSVMDKYEGRLTDQYQQLYELFRKYRA